MKKKFPIQVLFREYFEGVMAALFLALFLRFFIVSILFIPSSNMEPNLKKGDFVLGLKISYGFPLPLMKGERLNAKFPRPGDIVSFRFPGDEEQTLIRRVIGLPGDKISFRQGQLFKNDELVQSLTPQGEFFQESLTQGPVKTSYSILTADSGEMATLVIPKNSVFVLADDRSTTDDSRDWGIVPLNNIESRIVLIWLSLDPQAPSFKLNRERILKWVK